jgi:hypothetical protein
MEVLRAEGVRWEGVHSMYRHVSPPPGSALARPASFSHRRLRSPDLCPGPQPVGGRSRCHRNARPGPSVPLQHDAMQKVRKPLPALAALVDFWWAGVRHPAFKRSECLYRFFVLRALHTTRSRVPVRRRAAGDGVGHHSAARPLNRLFLTGLKPLGQTRPPPPPLGLLSCLCSLGPAGLGSAARAGLGGAKPVPRPFGPG